MSVAVSATTVWAPSGASAAVLGSCSKGSDVAVIGDSLFAQAKPEVSWAVGANGYTLVAYDAQFGRRSTEVTELFGTKVRSGVSAISKARGNADCWVIGLGTNDAGLDSDAADVAAFASRIDAVMAAVPSQASVYWLDTYVAAGARAFAANPLAAGRAIAWNAALHAAADRWPSLTIVSFSRRAVTEAGVIDPDGVHLTAVGRVARARTVIDALFGVVIVEPETRVSTM